MNKYFTILFRQPKKNTVLTQLRERLLKVMLLSSCLLGTVLYATALVPVLQKGQYSTILAYTILYIWIILITFLPRLNYRTRSIGWLGLFFVLGSLNLVMSGFNVDAGLFFITFIAMAILLMDLPAGLAALVLSCVIISIFGFANATAHVKLVIGLPQSNPMLWIIGGIVFLLMGILLIFSLTIVVTGLEENLVKTTRLAEELERANDSLRISEGRYRTLMETSPGLVVLLDLKGNILMVNQAGLSLFGYENLDEVNGQHFSTFIAPEDQGRVAEAFQRTLEIGAPEEFECLAIRKNGVTFFAEFNAALVVDEAGKSLAVIGVGRDITAHKESERLLQEAKDALAKKVIETTVQLERTAGRLEELVKHGPTVVYSYQASDFALSYVSENVATLLGFAASDFSNGELFWERVHPEDKKHIMALRDQGKIQDRYAYEYRFLHKNGTYRWLHDERVLVRDAQGNPQQYVGSCSDITDRKITEETLKISEAKYRNLYESMMDAYVSADMEGRIQQFNQAYEKMLGYKADELRQLTYMNITPEKWHGIEAEIVEKQILPRGYSDIYEKEYIRNDGTILPVELRSVLTRDEAGNPSGMWAIVRDISDRKRIEQTLRESEGRYRILLDNSMQAVFVFQDMRIIYVNETVLASLGYEEAKLRSLAPAEMIMLVHPEDRRMFQERLQRPHAGAQTPEQYSLRILRKNGEVRWVEARSVPIELQGKPALMVTAIDVTEIRKAEAELQESARIQQTIINASDALVFLVDTNGVILSSNDKFAERMGTSVDSIVGTPINRYLPEEVVRVRTVPFNQVISTGKPITFVDFREGTWFENSFYPVLDASGRVERVAVFARDITEQRRVTEALRASEEQYRMLAEAAHDMIYIIDRDDRIAYVNSFGANFLGQPPQQLIGQTRGRFFPPDTGKHQEDSIRRVFTTGQAISSETANVFPERMVWLNTWLVPLKDSSGEVISVLGVSRDITERKLSEVALQQARDQLEERVAERTKELLASQEKLRFLTDQTITAQEEERRAISRELHDEAGQALITLKYGLAAIHSELPETEALPRQRLSESMKIIDQTMVHIRSLAHSLRPPVLEIGGIHLSLQDYCQELAERTQIPIFYQGLDIPGIPDEIGISLYRFVQEALTNIMKHAQATKVKVSLQYTKGEIKLSVSDNGHGIDDTAQAGGVGLLGIRERLNLLNGKLEIHSRIGRGTKVIAHVPWLMAGIK